MLSLRLMEARQSKRLKDITTKRPLDELMSELVFQ